MDLGRNKSKSITIQGHQVILDSDVAEVTKRINEAIKNNPDKFSDGYKVTLTDKEFEILRSKISTAKLNRYRVVSHTFTEHGFYGPSNIPKSPVATETVLGIIETFAKARKLSRNIAELHLHDEEKQKSTLHKSGEIISDIFRSDLEPVETETAIELNLAVLSVKYSVKQTSKKE
jgi:hypothetical protein